MRAVFYERKGPAREVLQLGELQDPEPGPGEVRVQVAVSEINPSDTTLRVRVARRFALEQAADAHEAVGLGGAGGKVVLELG